MWFTPSLLHTEALQKIIRSNRNRLEIEMHELILDIMESVGTDTFSFDCNDIFLLLRYSQAKVEKHQVRRVLKECWKLNPAPNTLTYTTYQLDYTRDCHYSPMRKTGRFYTVTKIVFWKHYDYFDEMMNKYINILKYRYLHSHQTFIKSISLMKGENRTDRPCPTP